MSELVVVLQEVEKTWRAGLEGQRGAQRVLDGITLRVDVGEIVGIAGAAGAGKSTVLRIAAGLLRPDAGDVSWAGRPAPPLSFATYLAADAAMHGFLTVREHLRLVAVQRELRRATEGRRLGEEVWPARLDLVDVLDRRIGELPVEVRRAVALCAAAQSGAELICLDGPLDGLAPGARRELRRRFHVAAASGIALLIAASDLGVLGGIAHRAALLRAGRVIAWVDPRHAAPRTSLELAVGAPRTAAARLRRHLAAACRRDGAVRVPLADRSAEEVLALCRAEGIRVLRSRVVTEPPGRWTVPRDSGYL